MPLDPPTLSTLLHAPSNKILFANGSQTTLTKSKSQGEPVSLSQHTSLASALHLCKDNICYKDLAPDWDF